MSKTFWGLTSILLLAVGFLTAGDEAGPNRGATESSPSRSEYFSWINNTNEGATEAQTMVNLEFFRWLHDEYGMALDIYAFDAGAIDGKRFYGRIDSDRFREQFPRDFAPMAEFAAEMGTRLGVWGGPDGFGDTPEEEAARIEQIVSLCRDLDFALFKFDAVCGPLRPEKVFGPAAVSRGDASTRLITLRNLSWEPVTYDVPLDGTIGLEGSGIVHVRRFHPTERIIGDFEFGDTVGVEVAPFRTFLLFVSTAGCDEPGIAGIDYEVVRHVSGRPTLLQPMTAPGSEIAPRRLAELRPVEIPADAEALYEATVFAADNNALEVRSLMRSGPTEIPQVKAARDAFFNQPVFKARGIWDRNLFDNDPSTGFWPSRKYGIDQRVRGGCFRLDLGEIVDGGRIVLHTPDEYALQPILLDEANWVEVSEDLRTWRRLRYMAGLRMEIELDGPIRYLRFPVTADRFNEITGTKNGSAMDRSQWRASNLFAHPSKMAPVAAWHARVSLDAAVTGDRLAIAIEGEHGIEGAYAAVKIGDRYIGAPERAAAFPSNTWEYVNARRGRGYTYFVPITKEMIGREIDMHVLGYDEDHTDLAPVVWLIPASAAPSGEMRTP